MPGWRRPSRGSPCQTPARGDRTMMRGDGVWPPRARDSSAWLGFFRCVDGAAQAARLAVTVARPQMLPGMLGRPLRRRVHHRVGSGGQRGGIPAQAKTHPGSAQRTAGQEVRRKHPEILPDHPVPLTRRCPGSGKLPATGHRDAGRPLSLCSYKSCLHSSAGFSLYHY